MGTDIDRLEILVEAEARNANQQLENLIRKLDRVATSLSNINGSGIGGTANGLQKFVNAAGGLSNVKTADFTRLTKNIEKISALNTQQIYGAASAISTISKAINGISGSSKGSQEIATLASDLARLGYSRVDKAIANLPLLTRELNNMLTVLSKSPRVSRNVIQMTNALANLSSQGARTGAASRSLANSLNVYSNSTTRARANTASLASAIGKLYANYFLVIRATKELWESVDNSMDYVETYNYFSVTMNKIGKDFAIASGEIGAASAEAYAEAFSTSMEELTQKMTGYSLGNSGELIESGTIGLGVDPQQIMNFQAKIGAVTNSVGLMGKVSVNTSKILSMLSSDMSSLTNTDLSTVMTNFSSGIIGQSRSLYKYGIDITNATLQTYAYELGLEKAVSEMTQAEKMQLRVLAILDQSKVAWGDQANTLNSVANQYRVLQQQSQNLSRTVGNLFLPIVQDALPVVNGLVIATNRLITSLGFSLYGESWLKDLQDGISGGTIDGDFEDLEEDINGATDAIEEFKGSVRGFDELNLINGGNNILGTDVGFGDIDLSDEIDGALSEYESVWDKAFADLENKAEVFADQFTEKLKIDDIVENFTRLADSVSGFGDEISPFTEGFGAGFVDYFESLAGISLDAFASGLDALSNVIDDIDPETLEKVGEKLGNLAGFAVTISGINGMSKAFTSFSGGMASIGGVLKAHPILSTFALGAGILALVDLASQGDTEAFAEGFGAIIDAYAELGTEIGNISQNVSSFDDKMKEINSGGEIARLYAEWKRLNDKTGELTDAEKGKLKLYADQLKELCPEVTPYIDENGRAFEGVADNIQAVIDKQIELYKLEATGDLYKQAYAAQTEAAIALEKATTQKDELYSKLKEGFSMLTDAEIQQAIDSYMKTGNLFVGTKSAATLQLDRMGLTGDPMAALFTDKKFSWNRWLGNDYGALKDGQAAVEEYVDALKELEEAQSVYDEASKAADDISEAYQNLGENATKGFEKGIEKGTGGASGAVTNFAGITARAFCEFYQIHSPSGLMEDYGEFWIKGFNLGIEGSIDSTLDLIVKLGDMIQEKLDSLEFTFPAIEVPEISYGSYGINSELSSTRNAVASSAYNEKKNSDSQTGTSTKKVEVALNLDRKTIYKAVVDCDKEQIERTGQSGFAY
ncbi:MAG: hypothetical protein IJZ23_08010 [Roseburia sp.]|nr:hypothetical protein [Roseburia sp.]